MTDTFYLLNKSDLINSLNFQFVANRSCVEYIENYYKEFELFVLTSFIEEINDILIHDADILQTNKILEKDEIVPLLNEKDRIIFCFLHRKLSDYLDEIMV